MNTEQELIKAELIDLKQRIAKLEKDLTKAPSQESPFWEPKPGGEYWFFDVATQNPEKYKNNLSFDTEAIARGDAFKTEEACEKDHLKRVLLQDIKRWRAEHDPESFSLDWKNFNQCKFELAYDHQYSKWSFIYRIDHQPLYDVFFSSKESLKACIEHFGSRLDLLREVV